MVQGFPENVQISYSFSESHWCTENTCQALIEWLGTWVRKQGFLQWVLLWYCASVHRKASLMEWVRAAHPERHVLFVPGGFTAELQPADVSIQQPLKHTNQTAGHAILCRVRVPGRGGAGPAPRHREASHGAVGSARLAPPLVDIRGGTSACGELHLNGTDEPTFDETELDKEEPPEETALIPHDDDDDDDAEDPVSTGTAVAEAVVPFSTVAAQVERAECFL